MNNTKNNKKKEERKSNNSNGMFDIKCRNILYENKRKWCVIYWDIHKPFRKSIS